jgi:hypothetical protein
MVIISYMNTKRSFFFFFFSNFYFFFLFQYKILHITKEGDSNKMCVCGVFMCVYKENRKESHVRHMRNDELKLPWW